MEYLEKSQQTSQTSCQRSKKFDVKKKNTITIDQKFSNPDESSSYQKQTVSSGSVPLKWYCANRDCLYFSQICSYMEVDSSCMCECNTKYRPYNEKDYEIDTNLAKCSKKPTLLENLCTHPSNDFHPDTPKKFSCDECLREYYRCTYDLMDDIYSEEEWITISMNNHRESTKEEYEWETFDRHPELTAYLKSLPILR